MKITDTTVDLPKWVASALIVGAFVAGGVIVEARLQLSHLATRITDASQSIREHKEVGAHPIAQHRITALEAKSATHDAELKRLRTDMTDVKAWLGAICDKVEAKCGDH